MNDLSLVQVSTALGISWQQLLKYEHAVDRISASRLFILARILGVTVDYFFEGLRCDGTTEPASDASWEKTASSNGRARDNVGELVRNFSRINVPERRHRVIDMVRALADQSDESDPNLAVKDAPGRLLRATHQ